MTWCLGLWPSLVMRRRADGLADLEVAVISTTLGCPPGHPATEPSIAAGVDHGAGRRGGGCCWSRGRVATRAPAPPPIHAGHQGHGGEQCHRPAALRRRCGEESPAGGGVVRGGGGKPRPMTRRRRPRLCRGGSVRVQVCVPCAAGGGGQRRLGALRDLRRCARPAGRSRAVAAGREGTGVRRCSGCSRHGTYCEPLNRGS